MTLEATLTQTEAPLLMWLALVFWVGLAVHHVFKALKG